MNAPATVDFLVRKDDLHQTDFVGCSSPQPLQEGQIRLKIDQFALTANNITYAAVGEQMGYWKFFPADDSAWGKVPVWGFATVIESQRPEIAVGERIYGYLPLASHLTVQADRLSPHGFVDAAEHRQSLHPVYNQYSRCAGDPGYHPDFEDEQMIYRPLFMTSFMIDDLLGDQGLFGAEQVILSSASSKTSFGTAHLLYKNRRSECRVVGLTSAKNTQFVEGLGCYDQVLAYEDLDQLSPDTPTVYVDMAGNGELRGNIHRHFQDSLKYSCAVGASHWDKMQFGEQLPGPPPTMFFAPDQIKKRTKDWGPEGLQQRTAAAWLGFIQSSSGWLQMQHESGQQAIQQTYSSLLDGSARPDRGFILSLP